MPGGQPGVPAAAVVGKDGTVTFVDPATSAAYASLPAGSPGALMLQGPMAPPVPGAAVRTVVVLPPAPGQPGRLVKLPGGGMAVTPSGIVAPRLVPGKAPVPNTDPPQGANLAIQQTPSGRIVVKPLAMFGYPNADDAGPLNAASLMAGGAGLSGVAGAIELMPAATYNMQSSWVAPPQLNIYGNGATLAASPLLGASAPSSGPSPVVACLYMHGPSGAGSNRALNYGGSIRDLQFDGTNGGPFACGLDIGDGWGQRLDHIQIHDFTFATSQIGWRLANDQFYTEKMVATNITCRNNYICCYMSSTVTGDISHGYCHIQLDCYLLNGNSTGGQNGVIVADGCNLYNSVLELYGNNQQTSNNISSKVLAIQGSNGAGSNSIIQYSQLYLKFEADGTGPNMAIDIWYGSASNSITECQGSLRSTGSAGNTNGVTGQLSFGGQIVPVGGDLQAIATAPTTWGPPWPS